MCQSPASPSDPKAALVADLTDVRNQIDLLNNLSPLPTPPTYNYYVDLVNAPASEHGNLEDIEQKLAQLDSIAIISQSGPYDRFVQTANSTSNSLSDQLAEVQALLAAIDQLTPVASVGKTVYLAKAIGEVPSKASHLTAILSQIALLENQIPLSHNPTSRCVETITSQNQGVSDNLSSINKKLADLEEITPESQTASSKYIVNDKEDKKSKLRLLLTQIQNKRRRLR